MQRIMTVLTAAWMAAAASWAQDTPRVLRTTVEDKPPAAATAAQPTPGAAPAPTPASKPKPRPTPKPASVPSSPKPAQPETSGSPDGTASRDSAKPAPSPASKGAAEIVSVTADVTQGYARILFLWSKPVGYKAELAAGILTITFDQPLILPDDRDKLPLNDYVSTIKLDDDRRTLRMPLKRRVRLHHSAGGPLIGIDLVPDSFTGDPPDVIDPSPPPPPNVPINAKLKVKVAEDRTTLIIEWGKPVTYTASVEDGQLKVVFDQGGSLNVERLKIDPPAFIKTASASAGDNQVILTLDIDHDSHVEHRAEQTSTVIDILAPGNDRVVDPVVIVPDEIAKAAGASPPPADKPSATPAPTGSDGAAVTAAEKKKAAEEKAKADAEAKAAATADEAADPNAASSPGHDADHLPAETAAADDHAPAEPAAAVKPDDHAAHDTPSPASDGDGRDHKADAADAPHDEAAAKADHGADAAHTGDAHETALTEPPLFTAIRERDTIRLQLPVLQDQPVAMFRRRSTVFILVPGAAEMPLEQLLAENRDLLSAAKVTRLENDSLLTLELAQPYAVTALNERRTWVAVISRDPQDAPEPIAVMRDARSVGNSKVRATLLRSARPVEWKDDVTGERLIVIPAAGPPQAVLGGRSYVEFAADATAQGMLIRPFSDDLLIQQSAADVVITTPHGLTLAAGEMSDYVPGSRPLVATNKPADMDFETWKGEGTFLEERSRLVNALHPNGDNLAESRLALIRFYLANDLGAEALGMLQVVAAEDKAMLSDPSFRALRGAALLLMQRPKEAWEDLGMPVFAADPAAELFRAVALAGLRQWSNARDAVLIGEAVIPSFRKDWQARFRLAGAEAAIESNTLDVAGRFLDGVPTDDMPPRVTAEAAYLRGMLDERLKRDREALIQYEAARGAAYRPLAARADFAAIALKHKIGEMKAAEAIARLEALRWQWRGDLVELNVLHKLGELQIAEGDYRNGLQTWRSAVLGFPEDEQTRRISSHMSEVFEDLFLHGKADSMPPVQALGLFYDFQELTPIGTMGDEIARKLADRLIAVDLLEQAAALLQHQVDRRLDGVAKAQIAAKLAAVYLMDKLPQKALAVLRNSSQTRLPDDLATQRRLLMGRTLSDLKQVDAALEAFEQDESVEAKRLRADVLWAGARWADTAGALEAILSRREDNPRALDGDDRYNIMRTAIAYTMADDSAGLQTLRNRFVTLMADAPEAAAFEIITRQLDPTGMEFREAVKAVAGVDTLDTFLRGIGLGKPAPGSASAAP